MLPDVSKTKGSTIVPMCWNHVTGQAKIALTLMDQVETLDPDTALAV